MTPQLSKCLKRIENISNTTFLAFQKKSIKPKNCQSFVPRIFLISFRFSEFFKCQWGQFQGNYNDNNSTVYFYSLKAHLEKKKQVVCTVNSKKNLSKFHTNNFLESPRQSLSNVNGVNFKEIIIIVIQKWSYLLLSLISTH